MVKRAIFYDDCRDASRLAAEWSQRTPASWTVLYSSPRYFYNVTTAIDEICTLMSISPIRDFELQILVKSNNVSADIGVWIRHGRDVVFAGVPGDIFIWLTGGLTQLYEYSAPGVGVLLVSVDDGVVWDVNKWYSLKIRAQGDVVKIKIWEYGLSEPDWNYSQYLTRLPKNSNGTVSLRAINRTAGFSDIRITPIPRTGGP
jgi:hypothetical protein